MARRFERSTVLIIFHHQDWLEELARQRQAIERGLLLSQAEIDALVETWLPRIAPAVKEEESFLLVDDQGRPLSPACHAPRWFCHLVALRHRAVHVQLYWQSPKLGPTLVCQVRSWDKSDFPGHIDLSVGGHVVGDRAPRDAALIEMDEELGLSVTDLTEPKLHYLGGYDCLNQVSADSFYDREWRDVYCAGIKSLQAIAFKDEEVVGIYLCPASHARDLLAQEVIPVAHGLAKSLPLCLEYLGV